MKTLMKRVGILTIIFGLSMALCFTANGTKAGAQGGIIQAQESEQDIDDPSEEYILPDKVAINNEGNIYVAGYFHGNIDFNPGIESDFMNTERFLGLYISRFDSYGRYQWVRNFGDDSQYWPCDIEQDETGNVYIAGSSSLGFKVAEYFERREILIRKLNADGELQWSYSGGSNGHNGCSALAVDDRGNSYLVCHPNGIDYEQDNSTEIQSLNTGKTYLVKFSPDGQFIWTQFWDNSPRPEIKYIRVDTSGSIYLAGRFKGTIDIDPGEDVYECTAIGDYDAFICMLNQEGDLEWVRTWGGTENEDILGISVDNEENAYIIGGFSGVVDFDPDASVSEYSSLEGNGVYISKFYGNGEYKWTKVFDHSGVFSVWGIGVDNYGNVYLGGHFTNAVDFDPGSGVNERSSNGAWDIFLAKFDSSCSLIWVCTWGGASDDVVRSMAVGGPGNIAVTGFFQGCVDFDPGQGVDERIGEGPFGDAFLAEFNCDGMFQWVNTW